MITVKPLAIIQQPQGTSVTLECLVTGLPKPSVFWISEKDEDHIIMPGARSNNMYVTSDGSLKIEDPSVEDSGHYVCTALNIVGSALARSHLVVFDNREFGQNGTANASSVHTEVYEQNSAHPNLDEARLGLLEDTIGNVLVTPLGPTSIRVSWRLNNGPGNRYVQGFKIHYRQRRTDRYENFQTITIRHASANTFTIQRLDEYVEYEIFVQPFHESISGLPSHMKLVRTHQDVPTEAPVIKSARMVNRTTAYVAWSVISEQHQNGPLTGYQVNKQQKSGS